MTLSVHIVRAAKNAVQATAKNQHIKKLGKDLSTEFFTNEDSPGNIQKLAYDAVQKAQNEGFHISFYSSDLDQQDALVGPPYETDI